MIFPLNTPQVNPNMAFWSSSYAPANYNDIDDGLRNNYNVAKNFLGRLATGVIGPREHKKHTHDNDENNDVKWILNKESPVSEPPVCGKMKLWRHQLAMLKRCMDIESIRGGNIRLVVTNAERYWVDVPKPRDIRIGIMNDPPGCGKTHVMLALLNSSSNVSNKKTYTKGLDITIIIAPQNLHAQWMHAIDSYFDANEISVLSVTSYAESCVVEEQCKKLLEKNANSPRVILTTPLQCGIIVGNLKINNVHVTRVVLDEVDTILKNDAIHNIPECDFVWFMSASFDPYVDRIIGPFSLSELSDNDVLDRVCKCDPTFMRSSQPTLQDPNFDIISIPDGYLACLRHVDKLTDRDWVCLNTLNYDKFCATAVDIYRGTHVNDACELVNLYHLEITETIERLKTSDSRDNHHTNSGGSGDDESGIGLEIRKLMDVKEKLQTEIAKYNTQQTIKTLTTTRSKLDEIHTLCTFITDSAVASKWVFFSDDDYILNLVTKIFDMNGIKYGTLDQGTLAKNQMILDDYKSKTSQNNVLLLNSLTDGCGLNLEMTTHIVFLHYTNEKLIEQVVCRGQRPGRTQRLNVICIYHENEIDRMNNSKSNKS